MVNSILPKKFVIVKFGRIDNPSKKNSSICWWLISLNFKVWKDCQSFQKSLEGLPILPKKVLLYFDRKNIFWKDWIYEVSILLGTGIFLDLVTIVSFHFHIRNGFFLPHGLLIILLWFHDFFITLVLLVRFGKFLHF